jgi:AcrR family transcriptional regulator
MNLHSNPVEAMAAERRADRTAETRERIERAALHHFVHQGIAETSIRDIAEKAQISLGAMYNHFESKEDLAWQLFIGGWDEIGRELRRRSQGEADFSSKLHSMIAYVFRRFDEDWLLVTYIFGARHQHLKRVSTARGGGRDNPYTMFRLVIAQAMGKGEIPRGDLDLKTALVVGAIIQAIDSRMLLRLKGDLADSAPAAARLCLAMLSK